MTHGEIGAVYLGNWMRDWSQIGDPHNPWVLRVLNILSMIRRGVGRAGPRMFQVRA